MKGARLLLFSSLAALSAPLLVAKCEALHYVLSGRVGDATSLQPVASATVAVLVNGKAPDPWGPESHAVVTTSADGRFSAEFFFDTFSHYSRCSGHQCERVPRTVFLTVSAPGYESRTYSLSGAAIPSDLGKESIAIAVPETELRLTQHVHSAS